MIATIGVLDSTDKSALTLAVHFSGEEAEVDTTVGRAARGADLSTLDRAGARELLARAPR
jgi:hypothetical protein